MNILTKLFDNLKLLFSVVQCVDENMPGLVNENVGAFSCFSDTESEEVYLNFFVLGMLCFTEYHITENLHQ